MHRYVYLYYIGLARRVKRRRVLTFGSHFFNIDVKRMVTAGFSARANLKPSGGRGMSYYAYCVAHVSQSEPWDVFPGVEDRPVFAVRDQKIAILVSRLEKLRMNDPRSVVQHGQVIHRAFERHTVLPFRYGTVFATEEQVGSLLRKNRDSFIEAIRQLRGKAEMHLKLQFRAPAPALSMAAAAGSRKGPARLMVSGGGYIVPGTQPADGENHESPAHRVAQYLKETLRPRQEQMAIRTAADGVVHMELRYLVDEHQVPILQKNSLPGFQSLEDFQMQVTGPWPPYHFLPLAAKLPARGERIAERPGRVPLRARAVRV